MEENKISYTQSVPQRVYGSCIYWLSIAAALIYTIGLLIVIAFQDRNIMDPHYVFYAIWEGKTAAAIWQEIGGGEFPGAHFWLHNLASGDGFIQFGLVLGLFCACAALLGTAIAFLWQKPRSRGWATVSLCIALVIILSALGIYYT